MIVRSAVRADMAAVCDLYNALIPTTTVAWTETMQTLDERLAWFENQQQRSWPVLVGEAEDGSIAGFASYGSFRGDGRWPGYRYTVEHTIHVAQSHWGSGVGRRLIETLLDHARDAGMHVMIGGIDADNDASLRFHERLGFTEVARMPEVGCKFGRWLDLVLMHRVLDDEPSR
jgi:L-amino acid N-acyltransferase